MTQSNEYVMPNPDDGTTTYQKVEVYRATDNAGSPNAFSLIATVDIDAYNENTVYVDASGLIDSWYKHRHKDTGSTVYSDYYPNIQFGDYLARQWIKTDIADTDVSLTKWDVWRDQTIQEMRLRGLTRIAGTQSVAPTSLTNETFSLNSDIRRVIRVEVYNPAGEYTAVYNSWQQRGRTLRIFHPSSYYSYKVYGLGELKCLSDLEDEHHLILRWGMKMHYAEYRQNQRLDLRPFMSRTKTSDVTSVRDFQLVYDEAKKMFQDLLMQAVSHMELEGPGYGGGVA